jgi:hypothetical protein
MTSRRDEALRVAEELLTELELQRLGPVDAARKTNRLARLIDDNEAMAWLRFEIAGYPSPLDSDAVRAATRSNRQASPGDDGSPRWWTGHLASLSADAEGARTELSSASSGTSHSEWAAAVEQQKAQRNANLRALISARSELVERILGAFYEYASARYQELRFGAAVESAFEVVRTRVDASIAELVPDALPKLSAAFENTTSYNAEDWASAAATCRRLLKAAADALRPPGPAKHERSMDDDHYINRLVDWIETQGSRATVTQMISADLSYLGRRLDSALQAGHKGVHAEVSRFDASRFVTGTYLLLGDILALREGSDADPPT